MSATKGAAQIDFDFTNKVLDTPTRLLVGLVRGSDTMESQHAAVVVKDRLTAIQRTILTILASDGPLNAKDLERRIEFRNLSPSTCRKRISELKQAGAIVQVGRKDGMAEWDIRRP